MSRRRPVTLIAAVLAATLAACTAEAPEPAPQATGTTGTGPPTEEAGATEVEAAGGDVTAPQNLLDDGQRHMDDDRGWTAQGNTTIGVTTEESYTPDSALEIVVDPDGPWPDDTETARVGTAPRAHGVPVDPGSTYEGAWRILPARAVSPVRCELRWFDADGAIIDTVEGPLDDQVSGEWTRHACSGTAPGDAAFASVRVFIARATYGDVHYVDDAWLVTEGGTPRTGPAPTLAEATPTSAPTAAATEASTGPPVTTLVDGEWPDETNTGVPDDAELTPSETLNVSEDGAIIEGLDISGTINVRADDVTIRRTRVRTDGARYGISIHGEATGTVIEEVTVVGTDDDCSVGVVHANYTLRRSNVSGCMDGLRIGSETTLEGNHIHSLRWAPGAHTDAVQSLGGTNIRIVGNTLEGRWQDSTAAIIMGTHNGPLDNILIEGNLLSGGTYTVYLGEKFDGDPAPANVRFIDNVWVADSWKYGAHNTSSTADITWAGNTTSDGRPLP